MEKRCIRNMVKPLPPPPSAFSRVLGSFRNIGQSHPEKQQVQQLWKACAEGEVEVFINSVFAAKDVQVVNKFGFGKVVCNPLERENPYVEHGPFIVSETTQVASLFKVNLENNWEKKTNVDVLDIFPLFCC